MRLINRRPKQLNGWLLGALPFVILLFVYLAASAARLEANPNDKLLPAFSSFAEAVERLGFEPDKRTGEYILWRDTGASLRRLAIGIAISTAIGLVFGIGIGLLPYVRTTLNPLVGVISVIPPLSVLPILFIVFGLGELAKVVLIVVGITPFLIRDLSLSVAAIPSEQIIKAQTLGANTWQIITRIAAPQIFPRLVAAMRLSLGPAWLFLIAAEAIASTEGLGYRIFLVRRYLAMDVILPYVAWITILAFVIDFLLRKYSNRAFRWASQGESL